MIKPTVGRVVWYMRDHLASKFDQPYAALIAFVHSDRLINIAYFDHNGVACNATSVVLVGDGEEFPNSPFCTWMPYQLGQAAKTEALERQFKG